MTGTPLPLPLVPVDWLAAHLGTADLVVVDASWYLPSQQRQARSEYLAGHIPGAVFWDIDALSDRASPLPHMLPDPESLGRAIGALGIGSRDRVVVYDGSPNHASAGRVWWTLRIAGHDRVAVLDGGFAAWTRAGLPVESGPVTRAPARFEVRFRPELVRSREEVDRASRSGSAQILDARSPGRFAGTEPEPRPGLRSGHIPGSKNLPYVELTGPDGLFHLPDTLRTRLEAAGIDLARPVITTCGSGVTACALALALDAVGHRSWSVYDGSWAEWGSGDQLIP